MFRFSWRPVHVSIVPLVLLPTSVLVMAVMVAADIAGVAGRRLLDQPVLIVPTIALLSLLSGVLCCRRRFPVATYAASVAVTAATMVFLQSASLGVTPLYWFASVSLGIRVSGVRLVSVVVAGIVVETLVVSAVRVWTPDGGDATFTTQLWVGAFNATLTTTALVLLGSVIASHRRQVEAGVTELDTAREEHRARIDRAIEAERTSMARELHDVAAHHLTGMLIQAKNADRLLTADPEKARELLSGAIGQGHRTLDGLRQIVGILRTADDARIPPQPMIADISSLVEEFRPLFADVSVAVCENSAAVDSGVQLACYRVVQESLSNASRHARGSTATVVVDRTNSVIVVNVTNDAGAGDADDPGQGLGLVGMRERVALLGGTLDAGACGDGWLVRAELPVDGRVAA